MSLPLRAFLAIGIICAGIEVPSASGQTSSVAAGSDGTVYRTDLYYRPHVRAENVVEKWRFSAPGEEEFPQAPILWNTNLVVFSFRRVVVYIGMGTVTHRYPQVRVLESATGSVRWHYNSATTNEAAFARVDVEGRVHCNGLLFEIGTGQQLAGSGPGYSASADGRDSVRATNGQPACVGRDGTFYENLHGGVLAHNPRTGRTNWLARAYGKTSPPIIGEDETIYSSDQNAFFALDPITGQRRWDVPSQQRVDHNTPELSSYLALNGNRVAILRGGVLQVRDGKSGAIVSTNKVGDSSRMPQDIKMIVAKPGRLHLGGGLGAGIAGDFDYADSPWPKENRDNENLATFRSLGAPVVVGQPQDEPVVNQVAVFTVHAGGSLPLSYQWLKDGSAVAGATNAAFEITVAGFADSVQVVVSNSFGRAESELAFPGRRLRAIAEGGFVSVRPSRRAFREGASVTLEAISRIGRPFKGWSGGLQSTENPATVSLFEDAYVKAEFHTANFDVLWPAPLSQDPGPPVADNEGRVFLVLGGEILAFDPEVQQEVWSLKTNSLSFPDLGWPQLSALESGQLLVASAKLLAVLDSATGRTLARRAFAENGEFVAAAPDGMIYRKAYGTPSRTEAMMPN